MNVRYIPLLLLACLPLPSYYLLLHALFTCLFLCVYDFLQQNEAMNLSTFPVRAQLHICHGFGTSMLHILLNFYYLLHLLVCPFRVHLVMLISPLIFDSDIIRSPVQAFR